MTESNIACSSPDRSDLPISDQAVTIDGEPWYRIENADAMRPFMMSVVSASDHWLFAASTGAVTAGRVSPDIALLPYDTEDRIAERRENTGGKTILRVTRDGQTQLWEPWSERQQGLYRITRSIRKHAWGDEVVFEEHNADLDLIYSASWRTGDRFGFVRKVTLVNAGPDCQVDVLDGLQNILPAGANMGIQKDLSVLVDAYKRHELDADSGLALYRMTAALSNNAKPCASLKAHVAFSAGLEPTAILLCKAQVDAFRAGGDIHTETDIRGRRGAYWVQATFALPSGGRRDWAICADVAKDHSQIIDLIDRLNETDPAARMAMLAEDVNANRRNLRRITAAADGLQCTGDATATGHHFANTLFNIMRGGVFADGYQIQRADLTDYITTQNRPLADSVADWIATLPEQMSLQQLRDEAAKIDNANLARIVGQYMPLIFARRHGGPTRPWNFFNIILRNADGSLKLNYQGNWRDIFQNWEALLQSYPAFVDNAVAVFLNATSLDGYNPCAISRDQITWHKADPARPGHKVGHAGDHQIIYLLKLLEMHNAIAPGTLTASLDKQAYSYSNIPYRIRRLDDILAEPFDSIEFDYDWDARVSQRAEQIGNDGRLLLTDNNSPRLASLLEKLLTLTTAKLANFVPGGGIWMNTQRPEWNDGNSALAGWGLSVVTLGYLHRFLTFVRDLVAESAKSEFAISADVLGVIERMHKALVDHHDHLAGDIDNRQRRSLLNALGNAQADFRWTFYNGAIEAELKTMSSESLLAFLDEALAHCKHTIELNRRADGLYHGYNVMAVGDDTASIHRLSEMLEGQVAVLSSGCIDDDEALKVLEALADSDLFVEDRNSYILCPEKKLPRFLDINTLPADAAERAPLLGALVDAGHCDLVTRDGRGRLHFAGPILNDDGIKAQLASLADDPRFAEMAARDGQAVRDMFEEMFDHRSFIGRAGTMYGYEGIGCIYWHMVAKLLVAVDERAAGAESDQTAKAFRAAYEKVRNGLGFTRGAKRYGAFPTDPYSHTRAEGGARQPGMTGQVKEELLTRLGEMGVQAINGKLHFGGPQLRDEALAEPTVFEYVDAQGRDRQLELKPGEQCFTLCQVPIVLSRGQANAITATRSDGTETTVEGSVLPATDTAAIYARSGKIDLLRVIVA